MTKRPSEGLWPIEVLSMASHPSKTPRIKSEWKGWQKLHIVSHETSMENYHRSFIYWSGVGCLQSQEVCNPRKLFSTWKTYRRSSIYVFSPLKSTQGSFISTMPQIHRIRRENVQHRRYHIPRRAGKGLESESLLFIKYFSKVFSHSREFFNENIF